MVAVPEIVNSEMITVTDTSKLVTDISNLYLNRKFSDVVLNIHGKKIHAHKNILSTRSEYFKSLFSEGSEDEVRNEFTISDVSEEAFLNMLQFIYTGNITISSDELCLNVLALAHRFLVKDLESGVTMKLKMVLNAKNVYSVLNTANKFDFEELRDACHSFMDRNASEMLSNDAFNDLSQKSLIKLLERDSFVAPEIEIFKSVEKWCETNHGLKHGVIECVRLQLLSVEEIYSIVWPSKLVKCENLLHAIAEVMDIKPKSSHPRTRLLVDENLASPLYKAEVISGTNTSGLLTGNRDVTKFASADTLGKDGITIKLGSVSHLNYIQMMLGNNTTQNYFYYIEVSLDQKKWTRIIDYIGFACRSVQDLYFEPQMAQFIRIVGTTNRGFHLVYVEAYFKSSVPKFINGIIYPDTNVATPEKNARITEGMSPEFLLNGETQNYGEYTGYTLNYLGKGIIVQLAQPSMISNMKLLLWDKDDRIYRYFIETSVGHNVWELAVDRRNEDCKSWQDLSFKERPVVFVKIVGTYNSKNSCFHCAHFECSARDAK